MLERVSYSTYNSLKYPEFRFVQITIEYDKDTVIASFGDVEAFAYADTEPEAIDLLCEGIVLLYEDLKNDRENLCKLSQKWLICLEEIIMC